MFIITLVVGLMLGSMFVGMGAGKLSGKMEAVREGAGLSESTFRIDGAASLAGGAGVLLGLIDGLSWLGIAAGIGLIALTTLAVAFHARRGDEPKDTAPALISLVLSVVYVIVRAASA